MKGTLLTIAAIALIATAMAQPPFVDGTPQGIRFQAIATSGTDDPRPVANQTINVRMNVITGTPGSTQTLEWEETHSPTTDVDGRFEVLIGTGTQTGGRRANFEEIKWDSTAHFLKVELDVTGSGVYVDMGTTQFLSVPYAFSCAVCGKAKYAEFAEHAEMADVAQFALEVASLPCDCTFDDVYNYEEANGFPHEIIADDGPLTIIVPALQATDGFKVINNSNNNTTASFVSNVTPAGNTNVLFQENGWGKNVRVEVLNPTNAWYSLESSTVGIGSAIYALSNNASNNPLTRPVFQAVAATSNASVIAISSTGNLTNVKPILVSYAWNPLTRAGEFQSMDITHNTDILYATTIGMGRAGMFEIDNIDNGANALQAETNGSGNAIRARSVTGGTGGAGSFEIEDAANTSNAVEVINAGSGITGFFESSNAANTASLFRAENSGAGATGTFLNFNAANSANVLEVENSGTGATATFWNLNNSNPTFTQFTRNSGIGVTGYFLNDFSGSNSPLFLGTNFGAGPNSIAGGFMNANPNNNAFTTLYANTVGTGTTAYFANDNYLSVADILQVAGQGTGTRIRSWTDFDSDFYVAHFSSDNPNGDTDILYCQTNTSGQAIICEKLVGGMSGTVTEFKNGEMNNTWPVSDVLQYGIGDGLRAVAQAGNAITAITSVGQPGNAIYGSNPGGPGYAGLFDGDVFVSGLFKYGLFAVVKNDQGLEKVTYALETTEYWFEDFGFGTLVNGEVVVNIDPEFASIVNTTEPYHVHIQLEGLCAGGVIVTDKTATSFKVVHNGPGSAQQCDAPFSYRITAKRNGFESLRLSTIVEARVATAQYIQDNFPEVIAEAKQIRIAAEQQMAASMPGLTVSTPDAAPSIDDIIPALPAVTPATQSARNQSNDEVLPPSEPPTIPGQ